MNAGEFAKRRARIEQEAHRRRPGYAGNAMAALLRESGASQVVVRGKLVAWKLPSGQTVCRKERYKTELDASIVLNICTTHPKNWKSPTRMYLCPWCDGWHLTSQAQYH